MTAGARFARRLAPLASMLVAACWNPPSRLGHRDGCQSACAPDQLCQGTACVDRIVEFDAPAPAPDTTFQAMYVAAGPDGNVWFTEFQNDLVVRITRDGVMTTFTSPAWGDSRSGPLEITSGPDGNLWLTTADRGRIARVAPDGRITELPEIAGVTSTAGIAVGPDGNIWFSARPSIIGRVNRDDTVSTFTLPTDIDVDPSALTAGPDGNLWFTIGDEIARMTPAGEVKRFSLPTAAAGPLGITTGPDGNLWFTEFNVAAIGRITTAGEVMEYALPGPVAPYRIVAGPDGNLWFTDQFEHIDRITTDGQLQRFQLSPGRTPLDITVGPDGNLWFTASLAKIARITMPRRSD